MSRIQTTAVPSAVELRGEDLWGEFFGGKFIIVTPETQLPAARPYYLKPTA
jgi:hypothetical protein